MNKIFPSFLVLLLSAAIASALADTNESEVPDTVKNTHHKHVASKKTTQSESKKAASFKEKRVIAKEPSSTESQDLGAKKLVSLLSNLQNMKADFKQLVLDAKGTHVQDVTGKMYVKRPGQFRWDVSSPFEQQIISDGNKVYVYDKDLEQVSIRKLDKQVGNTPALLLSGNPDELDKTFDITALGAPMGNAYQFELRPRSKEKLFDVLKVSFRDGVIVDMFMQDGLGQKTSIDFVKPEINGDVPASMFNFVAPKGADVIDESK